MKDLLRIALFVVVFAPTSVAQSRADFSGRWQIDLVRSGPLIDVWGQTRATTFVITQTQHELQLSSDGGGLSVPSTLQKYRLDGDEMALTDDSLGELDNFVRKVRTQARWQGETLVLETEPFHETIDKKTGTLKRGRGITSVLELRLEDAGRTLSVIRRGFRAEPPPMLHGRKYDRADDLVYHVDRVQYQKLAP